MSGAPSGARKLSVLLIGEAMIPSLRLCAHSQLTLLAEAGRVSYRFRKPYALTDDDLNCAQIVIFGRLDSWFSVHLARQLRRAGKYLIYLLDDDLLNVPADMPAGAHHSRPEVRAHIAEMLELSDAVLSPSPLLLQKYAGVQRRAIEVIEPAIEPAESCTVNKDTVRIGFAGSIDRMGDVERILGEALLRIRATYGGRVSFLFFGGEPSFAQALGARCIPYCDSYEAYRQAIGEASLDIGLAPMPDTPFHACKHYNKFIEYAAVGAACVFSDVPPYTRLRTLGGPGIYCENTPDAWYAALSELITDSGRREQLRGDVLRFVREHMCVETAAEALLTQLRACPIGDAGRKKRCYFTGISRCVDRIIRVVRFAAGHGSRAPADALHKLRSRKRV